MDHCLLGFARRAQCFHRSGTSKEREQPKLLLVIFRDGWMEHIGNAAAYRNGDLIHDSITHSYDRDNFISLTLLGAVSPYEG